MNLKLLPFVLAILLVLAGCNAPVDDREDASGTTTSAAANALKFTNHPKLGEILTDPNGKTLYVFTNDERGVSKCYGTCATNWPPYTSDETPTGPPEVASKLNLTTRTDGTKQVAYRGLPLYYWAKDKNASDATGDGVGGIWFVVRKPPANSQMLNGKGTYEVDAENVTYSGQTRGFYATARGLDDGAADTGVVMIHEWWGLNDNIREMAKILASHGYQVLAVDLFKGKVATTSQEAQAQVGALNQAEATQNMKDAVKYLRDRGANRIVSLGWCFGGGQSLQLALSGETLVATVIYYGFLDTNQQNLSKIKWPVQGIFGEKDQAIRVPTVRAFESALKNNSITNEIFIYPEVGHAFANPSGDAWAPEETKDAWARTLDFLKRNAQGGRT